MNLYNDKQKDDTKKIQDLLDEGGIVTIDNGDYFISKTLIIHSDTTFILAPNAKLILKDNARCALIENEHFRGGGRDYNIQVIGGIFDGNSDNQGFDCYDLIEHRNDFSYDPDRYSGKLIRFCHVDKITLKDLTVRNPNGYGIQIGDTVDFIVKDIFFDYNWHYGCTDGVHINGPAREGVIENLSGTTNDDMVSLTPVDEQHAECSEGEIKNITIRNVTANNGYSGVRLLSCGNYPLTQIKVDGVYGDYRHNALLLGHHYARPSDTRNWFDDIVIENVRANKSSTPLDNSCFTLWEEGAIETLPVIWLFNDINIGKIAFKNIYRYESVKTNTSLLKIEKDVTVDTLLLDNVRQTLTEGSDGKLLELNGTIKNLVKVNVTE
ncbi:MAG: hypothetical protein J6B79_06195 [Clostridia bacterium]|nr:hypothetical protein [Clostridia bacterium]